MALVTTIGMRFLQVWGGQCPHPHGSDSPENGCGIYGREVMKSLPLPFLLLFAVLFFLMVQLITFEAFLSSLVPLLFFFSRALSSPGGGVKQHSQEPSKLLHLQSFLYFM